MMLVSPSIASADVLNVASEVAFIDRYFNNIHIDIEDGVAVGGISFGMKMAKGICSISTSREKTMHLEVLNPLDYLEDVLACDCDVTFIQVSHLPKPMVVIEKFAKAGVRVGVNLCDEDLDRSDLKDLIDASDFILVNTTAHWDPEQNYLSGMEEFALKLAQEKKKKIWIDGCVTYETYERLKNSGVYCAVIGRGIFKDKELAVKQFCR
jgi:pentose-5-phosphate-3-epimerase